MKFQDLQISSTLLTALKQMNIDKATEIQTSAIPVALQGLDVIAVAQTGSGKTLAFALPLLIHLEKKSNARALVLAPSREMAQQIFKVFSQLNTEKPLTTSLLIGGVPTAKQISGLKKNPRLVIATPGRLNDHLKNNKLLLQNLSILVIDEADRMLDMGFAPQLKNVQSTLRTKPQTLMFSASFNASLESIAQGFMKSKPVMIRSQQAEAPVGSLKQKILFIERAKKNDRLLDELNAAKGSVIVFCGNQESCAEVADYLESYGFSVDLIHGGLTQGNRNRVVRQFREGQLRVVVATDLLARGLDVPHVDHVINFELPFQAEDFLHRIGRTARAGRDGNALTFVTPSDNRMFEKIKPYLQGASISHADKDSSLTTTEKKTELQKKEKPRVDKYASLAALSTGKGKPSVWKKR